MEFISFFPLLIGNLNIFVISGNVKVEAWVLLWFYLFSLFILYLCGKLRERFLL